MTKIIDVHAHVMEPTDPDWLPSWMYRGGVKEVRELAKSHGVTLSILSDASDTLPSRKREEALLEECRRYDDIMMWHSINPLERDFYKKALSFAEDKCVAGFAAHVWKAGVDLDRDGKDLIALSAETGKPVFMHMNIKDPDPKGVPYDIPSVVKLAEEEPKAAFIIAHMGRGQIPWGLPQELLSWLSLNTKHRNIYMELSLYDIIFVNFVEILCKEGSDRLLFGSDSPCQYIQPLIERLKHGKLSIEEQECIFYKNAERLICG